MSLSHLYNTTMNVYTITTSDQTDTGGVDEVETIRLSDVPCLIEAIRAEERELLGREAQVATHRIYCDTDNAIVEEDRIKIGSRTFDIVLPDDVQGKGHHNEILVIERR